jgi:ATPase subunit of ABC transporter with duplicated ATPase domains
MLLTLSITEKTMGVKVLFQDLSFTINKGEKIAAIGRNGVGKTTLFRMISQEDTEYLGSIEIPKDVRIIMTAQEHFGFEELNPVEYILRSVPEYHELKHIVDTYPDQMGDDMEKIHVYSDALHTFTERDYYVIEDRIVDSLAAFEIDIERAYAPLSSLSGGQKRFVELVKVLYGQADLVLLDEPTNHMDYVGKELFLNWLRNTKQAVFVISHDRDVLKEVDAILEIKDKKISTYPGNYDAYLKQNSTATITQVSSYEEGLKALDKLHKQIQAARARKAGAGNSRPKVLEERLMREHAELKARLKKPSFWIDQDSVSEMNDKNTEQYERYKDRNIKISQGQVKEYKHVLLQAKELSVGYDKPLFENVHFQLEHEDRVFLKGRNGAGKSTLVKTILSQATGSDTHGATIFHGKIEVSPKLRIGMYEQELDPIFLPLTLEQGLLEVYHQNKVPLDTQRINQLLAMYLFDPIQDKKLRISSLSGGQKARFQIIKMLCTNPNLLILDEPTNHLDLPSIEELEAALQTYAGAILYISHDSYFTNKIGGDTVHIGV